MPIRTTPERSSRGAICVFAKRPRPGEVKTRLVPELGEEAAADLARVFMADTWSSATSLPWADPILATTQLDPPDLDLGPSGRAWLQGEGDLGARLERILRRALRRRAFAIAIGTDTPGLPPELLEQARSALCRHDAVVGPCEDGGFYLLGLVRCPRGLLQSLPWSQENTFASTLLRLRSAGLSTKVLSPWFDVDRPEDLRCFERLLDAGEIVAPQTRRWLARAPRASGSRLLKSRPWREKS